MKIIVSGGIELGQSLIEYVNEKLNKNNFETIAVAEVTFKKQGPMIYSSIVVNDSVKKGIRINGDSEGESARFAFDEALKKVLIQLNKEKDKLLSEKKKGTK